MNQHSHQIIAIDLAKDSLQGLSPKGSFSISNNQKGFTKLKTLARSLDNPLVVVEATGGYERPLLDFLHAQDVAVALINPKRIRAFAISEGVNAKSDPIDTEMIMRFAKNKNLRLTPAPDPVRKQLAELLDRRNQLSEALTAEKIDSKKHPNLSVL